MKHEPLKTPVGAKKTDIWKKYKEVLEELRASEVVKSTVAQAKSQAVAKAVGTAQNVCVDSVNTVMKSLVDSLSSAKSEYEDLLVAINAKKEELKEVHSLEVEANSLVAVVTAKDQLVEEREARAKEILEEAKLAAQTHLDNAKEQAKTTVEEVLLETRQALQDRERAEEEYNYNWEREKKQRTDTLQDALGLKVKTIELREAAVTERESAAEELQTTISNLEGELLDAKQATEQAVAAAVDAAKKSSAQSAAIAKAMDNRSHEADMAIAAAKSETLEAQVADLQTRLQVANESVQAANAKVAEMAQSALQAGADAKTVAELHNAAALGKGK